jgi:hypothetical protein
MTALSEIFLSEYEAITFMAYIYCIILCVIVVIYLSNRRKLKKKAKGRASISMSVRLLKRKDKWNAIGTALNLLSVLMLFTVLIIMSMQYQHSIDKLAESINNYHALITMKNNEISLISNDCADMLEKGDARNEDLTWVAGKLRKDIKWLEDNYSSCLERNSELEDMMDNMPFLAAGEAFVGNHTYDKRDFNCVDYSNGCVDTWRKMGYNAYTRTVRVNCSQLYCPDGNNRHMIAIIEIPMECSGSFSPIPTSEFPKYNLFG